MLDSVHWLRYTGYTQQCLRTLPYYHLPVSGCHYIVTWGLTARNVEPAEMAVGREQPCKCHVTAGYCGDRSKTTMRNCGKRYFLCGAINLITIRTQYTIQTLNMWQQHKKVTASEGAFPVTIVSRLALGLTQTPNQYTRCYFPGGKAAEYDDAETSLPATAKIRNAKRYASTLHYPHKHRDIFTFRAVMTTIQPKTDSDPAAEILCTLHTT